MLPCLIELHRLLTTHRHLTRGECCTRLKIISVNYSMQGVSVLVLCTAAVAIVKASPLAHRHQAALWAVPNGKMQEPEN
jgi:hypothetical protein